MIIHVHEIYCSQDLESYIVNLTYYLYQLPFIFELDTCHHHY